MKNQNKIVAVVFFAAVAISSVLEFLYVADRYPFGFLTALLGLRLLLLFASGAVFAAGTLIKSRAALISAEGIFLGSIAASFLLCFMTGIEISGMVHIILTAAEFAAVIIMIVYTSGVIKNKYVPGVFMSGALIAAILRAAIAGTAFLSATYLSEAILISALIVMAVYPDLSGKRRVKTGEVLWLSAATFGVYLAVWAADVVKKMTVLSGRTDYLKKAAAFIIFSPYRIYWYYTVYEEQAKFKNRGILLSALSFFGMLMSAVAALSGVPEASISGAGVSLVALALVQRDLNSLVSDAEEEEKNGDLTEPEPVSDEEMSVEE